MDNIRHLSEVLKSQISLYSELTELLVAEKQSVIAWAIDETVEITRKKEALLKRERIQDEARTALLSKISAEAQLPDIKLADVVKIARENNPELAKELDNIGDRLVELITRLQAENVSLRILYSTNSRLISDFFVSAGLSDSSGYGSSTNRKTSRLQNIVG